MYPTESLALRGITSVSLMHFPVVLVRISVLNIPSVICEHTIALAIVVPCVQNPCVQIRKGYVAVSNFFRVPECNVGHQNVKQIAYHRSADR